MRRPFGAESHAVSSEVEAFARFWEVDPMTRDTLSWWVFVAMDVVYGTNPWTAVSVSVAFGVRREDVGTRLPSRRWFDEFSARDTEDRGWCPVLYG